VVPWLRRIDGLRFAFEVWKLAVKTVACEIQSESLAEDLKNHH